MRKKAIGVARVVNKRKGKQKKKKREASQKQMRWDLERNNILNRKNDDTSANVNVSRRDYDSAGNSKGFGDAI